MKIIGFGGSLRKGSYNLMLLNEFKRINQDLFDVEIADISGIPVYNQDLDSNQPESVTLLRERVKSSDGFVISTPEYDFSIPGFLKNTLDYLSRPVGMNPFSGKAGAIMSTSISMLGGSRAQYHLRQVLTYLDTRIVNKPEIFVTFANQKFDENGRLKDEMTTKFIRELGEKLRSEINKSSLT
ncbi:MAG: NAD(P)H-dependent oxidoreductase [Candidatus Thermoplasmatota archaeon]|jgi:chromate reductase|nr:NAD(P)H-dependent oxidoreductase [Candidatus Thermoplasmatota archaeon]MCL5791218.1 NAD(P)H-dependent oxidoreductase [Candidatus Thermoplasmatota archaeon]